MRLARWLMTLALALVLALVFSSSPASATDADGDGIEDQYEVAGWGEDPGQPNGLGFEKWSYSDYKVNCLPATTTSPAYELLWVTNEALPNRVPFLDVDPNKVKIQVRRASSVFAASNGRGYATPSGKLNDRTPRIITGAPSANGVCQAKITKVSVPEAVYKREPYQDWDHDADPATPNQQGIWAYLEDRGYNAEGRRYITIVDGTNVWNHLGGAMTTPAGGSAYGPTDNQPGQENANNADGTWGYLSVENSADGFDPASSDSFGEHLAHELAHGVGAVLEGTPDYNPGNPGHPSDCADLLCYNHYDADGQHYNECGGATADTFNAYSLGGWGSWKGAYRLDCHKDTYWNATEVWDRWNGFNSSFGWGAPDGYTGHRFTNPDIAPECIYDPAGFCPPDVTPPSSARTKAPQPDSVAVD